MARQTLGLIGVGAFGSLAAKHLAPHFDLALFDAVNDVSLLAQSLSCRLGSLEECAACDLVVLAVPVQRLRATLSAIAPHVRAGALVLDVSSVKMKPLSVMEEMLPEHCSIVGTHPLFGPQSGKHGITGLNIVICDRRGGRGSKVANFCADELGLNVHEVSPEEHDREAAYVQGLTHLIARVVMALDLPPMRFPTKTYQIMQEMVEMVRYDSEDVFRAIEAENPFAAEAKKAFFTAARKLEESLSQTLR